MFKLFETGKLSLGQAASLAGYSKSTFIELLGKQGIPVIDYPPEELEQELNF
jgi:predicted HTH domain antitoxin